nr:permease-like cell division protein FtsX [Halorhodospira abdelmalekii]
MLYGVRHLQAARTALGRLASSLVHSVLTVAVVGIALALPAALWVALENIERVTGGWQEGAPQISLFLERDLSDGAVMNLAAQLRQRTEVAEVRVITPEEALAELQAETEMQQALALLDENPLPPVVVLTVAAQLEPTAVARLAEGLAGQAQVAQMRLDQEWVERLHALMTLVERALLAIALLLAVAVVLVVGNTIRLTVESRREEIEIIKLIGGSNGFVRRPFLYEGLVYGLLGGTGAWMLIEVGRWSLQTPVQQLAASYGTSHTLTGLGFENTVWLLLGAALFGLLGAWIAVARHIAAIEPA